MAVSVGGAALLPSIGAADDEVVLVLDPTLHESVLAQVPKAEPRIMIARTVENQAIDNVGNFGRTMHFEQRSQYSRQPNGLWAMEFNGKVKSVDSGNVGRQVSLCGLVALVGESAGSMTVENTSVLPVGKMFVPFGFKSKIDSGRRGRVKAFETNSKTLCEPAPGSEFTYRVETELQTKTSGMFGRTSTQTIVEDNKCKTASELQPASNFNAALSGAALRVSCNRADKAGKTKTVEYLYIQDSAVFLYFGESADAQSIKVQYSEVEHTRP